MKVIKRFIENIHLKLFIRGIKKEIEKEIARVECLTKESD